MIRVKICGITRPEDALVAAEAGAWAIGLMFTRQSPRFVTARQALAVIEALPKTVLRVGVFMNQSLDVIRKVQAKIPLDLIQLHGREPKELCLEIGRERCMKAMALNNADSVNAALKYPSDFLLVDRPRDEVPALPLSPSPTIVGEGRDEGQSTGVMPSPCPVPEGEGIRWKLAEELARKRDKVLLAGGLNPKNVAEAIRAARPWGVDVSRGLETAPGIKDAGLISAFMEAVQMADRAGS